MLIADELNVTYITLDGFIQVHRYRYLYFVMIFAVYILILCFNSTIVFVIAFQRSLHEPMYIFIAALLVNSVMFSSVFYPKFLIDVLSERQTISYAGCFFQNFMFYSLGASEFLLLTAMSYDRYVSICKPLQYPTTITKRTVTILLVLAWIVPAFYLGVFTYFVVYFNSQLCNFTLKGILCKSPLHSLLCVYPKALVILPVLKLINVVLLPLLLIFFSYTRIIIISYQSCKEVKKKAAQTCLPHLLVLINYLCLCVSDVIVLSLELEFSKTVNLVITFQTVMNQPLLNPIIYGLKMKEICKQLKRLLCF